MVGKKWIDHCLSSLFEVCFPTLAHDSCYTSVRPYFHDSKSYLSLWFSGWEPNGYCMAHRDTPEQAPGLEILNLHTFHIQLQLPGIRMWIFPGNHYSVHILDTENRTSADKGSEPFAWSQFLHLSIVRDRKLQEPQSPHWGQPVVPRAILEAVGNGVRPQEDDFAVGDTCSLHSHC